MKQNVANCRSLKLYDQARYGWDPFGIKRNTRECGGQTNFASGCGTKADDADLVVDALVDETQRATRITLCLKIEHLI